MKYKKLKNLEKVVNILLDKNKITGIEFIEELTISSCILVSLKFHDIIITAIGYGDDIVRIKTVGKYQDIFMYTVNFNNDIETITDNIIDFIFKVYMIDTRKYEVFEDIKVLENICKGN